MARFIDRNEKHSALLKQIDDDANKYQYSIQPMGNETLEKPLNGRCKDKTSWVIRATPDRLATTHRSMLLEVKAKLNDKDYINIELNPLEQYKNNPGEVFLIIETKLDGGLRSCKVVNVKDITIKNICIPNRKDNIGKLKELREKYPSASVNECPFIPGGGSGTPYVKVPFRDIINCIGFHKFRDEIILHKEDNWVTNRKFGMQETLRGI